FSLTSKARRLLIRRKLSGRSSHGYGEPRCKLTGVPRGERLYKLSEDDLEELNAVPFSGIIGIERRVLHPSAIPSRRPWIEHLKGVAAGTKGFRKCALNSCPFGNRRRLLHRAHRFLSTDRCPEFLRRSSRHQPSQNCDHQCLHVSLSFEACEMLPITTPAHNISFDGFS